MVEAAFRAGDLDAATIRDADTLARYMNDPNVVVHTNSGTNINYITMNPNMPPFDDIRVRKAVLHAIDTEAILATVLQGITVPLTGPVPSVTNFYEPNVTRYEYNPELSRRLLAEAGYPNGFQTTLFTYIGGPAVPVSTIVQDMLAASGYSGELAGSGDFRVERDGGQLRCADDVHASHQVVGSARVPHSHPAQRKRAAVQLQPLRQRAGGPADLRGLGRDGSRTAGRDLFGNPEDRRR